MAGMGAAAIGGTVVTCTMCLLDWHTVCRDVVLDSAAAVAGELTDALRARAGHNGGDNVLTEIVGGEDVASMLCAWCTLCFAR